MAGKNKSKQSSDKKSKTKSTSKSSDNKDIDTARHVYQGPVVGGG